MQYPKLAQFKQIEQFRERLKQLQIDIPTETWPACGDELPPLGRPFSFGDRSIGNRWCIHPMEGWDCNPDGHPSELTKRRWARFGQSGAKLIWGGEATAVQADGRANPRQLMGTAEHLASLEELVDTLRAEHRRCHGTSEDLLVGLQLTHSGRFSRPNDHRLEPRIAYHHPILDRKFGIDPHDDSIVWSDSQLHDLIRNYVSSARVAREAGFDFVDVKACHGYLLHEFLSAYDRHGAYGGDLKGRSRLLRQIVEAIHRDCHGLKVGVRLSVFDFPPFAQGKEVGELCLESDHGVYRHAFGMDRKTPLQVDLNEPIELLQMLRSSGVFCVNLSCGSPYYNPHIQRPAFYPPSDGYLPPEDPLVGVARQIHAVRLCKIALPELPMVGTGYSYLQEFLPHVANAAIRNDWVDIVGIGRMVLSYPELPKDVLAGRTLERKHVCRTFSDCTTAPRNGLESGCYPLDPFYKELPQHELVKLLRKNLN